MDYNECRNSTTINLIAGAVGGTIAAIATCPLEVIKTRLQSSGEVFQPVTRQVTSVSTIAGRLEQYSKPTGILGCMRHIISTEGYRSLYKGLGPNLIGVAPARAIYFAVYVKSSKIIGQKGIINQDNPLTHMLAGASAGFVTHTLTAPVWFVKTRLQLSNQSKYGMMRCIAKVYKSEGIRGFYRGLSASYFGVLETIIHFVIYERLKKILREYHRDNSLDHLEKNQLTDFMLSAGCSKTCASIIAYPHEVVRTRLRQETHDSERKYRKFFQTLVLVYKEEGRPGLYGGLGTQLVRQIPNTAVMFMVYESIIFYLCENDQNDS